MMLTMMSHLLAGMAHLATQPNMTTDQDKLQHRAAVLEWQEEVTGVIQKVQRLLVPSEAAS
jgi:hypothetical protein